MGIIMLGSESERERVSTLKLFKPINGSPFDTYVLLFDSYLKYTNISLEYDVLSIAYSYILFVLFLYI